MYKDKIHDANMISDSLSRDNREAVTGQGSGYCFTK